MSTISALTEFLVAALHPVPLHLLVKTLFAGSRVSGCAILVTLVALSSLELAPSLVLLFILALFPQLGQRNVLLLAFRGTIAVFAVLLKFTSASSASISCVDLPLLVVFLRVTVTALVSSVTLAAL